MKLENILSGLQDLKVRGTLEIEISKGLMQMVMNI